MFIKRNGVKSTLVQIILYLHIFFSFCSRNITFCTVGVHTSFYCTINDYNQWLPICD